MAGAHLGQAAHADWQPAGLAFQMALLNCPEQAGQ